MSEKNLIVYYSRTGVTETLAMKLRDKLGGDIDRIDYATNKKIAFTAAALESLSKSTIKIKGDNHDPALYDRVICITPIWSGQRLSAPMRSYMAMNKKKLKEYSLIVTCNFTKIERAIKDSTDLIGNPPKSSARYISSQIQSGSYELPEI